MHRGIFVILGIVLVGTAAVVTIIILYAPHAAITLHPSSVHKTATQAITLSKDIQAADYIRFLLPARIIEKTVSHQQEVSHQGGAVTEDFAKGTATLHNDQDTKLSLLPQTHLKAQQSGVFFLLDKAVVVEPHTTAEVAITAEQKGASGDSGPDKLFVDKLPATVQSVIYAESSKGTSGGQTSQNPITQQEIDQAKKELHQKTEDEAWQQISKDAGGVSLNKGLQSIEVQADESSAQPGSTATTFIVSYTIKVRAFVVDQNDLLSLTVLALRNIPPDQNYTFTKYDPASFQVSIKTVNWTTGQAQISCTLTGMYNAAIDQASIKKLDLVNKTKDQLTEYFKQFPTVGSVDVEFSPFWVKKTPSRAGAIAIEIKN
jgi:hypothetical protein